MLHVYFYYGVGAAARAVTPEATVVRTARAERSSPGTRPLVSHSRVAILPRRDEPPPRILTERPRHRPDIIMREDSVT